MNPGEAIGWTEFDVLARDAAVGAHVAMCLREQLPGAFVRSEPDPASSGDEAHPHLLHCSATVAERGSEETRRLLEEAVGRIEPLAGGHPPARVVFTGEAAAEARRRAA